MFEKRHQPLAERRLFMQRVVRYMGLALGIIFGSLLIGIFGYRYLDGLPWIDALLNAAMILGGMGPVNELHTMAGKLFVSFYALFSGMVLLVAVGVLIAPVFHRFLHHFHLVIDEEAGDD